MGVRCRFPVAFVLSDGWSWCWDGLDRRSAFSSRLLHDNVRASGKLAVVSGIVALGRLRCAGTLDARVREQPGLVSCVVVECPDDQRTGIVGEADASLRVERVDCLPKGLESLVEELIVERSVAAIPAARPCPVERVYKLKMIKRDLVRDLLAEAGHSQIVVAERGLAAMGLQQCGHPTVTEVHPLEIT